MSPWISFTENKKKYRARQKCSRGGSNSRPSDYETDALPTELLKLSVMEDSSIKCFNTQ